MPKFWYDYVKPKNAEAKLYYMNTDSFLANIKTEKNYVGIAQDVETRFYTLNYEIERQYLKEKMKKCN